MHRGFYYNANILSTNNQKDLYKIMDNLHKGTGQVTQTQSAKESANPIATEFTTSLSQRLPT